MQFLALVDRHRTKIEGGCARVGEGGLTRDGLSNGDQASERACAFVAADGSIELDRSMARIVRWSAGVRVEPHRIVVIAKRASSPEGAR